MESDDSVAYDVRLAMVGLPGAGKTVQGKRIAEEYAVAYISTGDLCRDNQEHVTVTGEAIGDYLDAGRLPPTEDVAHLLGQTVEDVSEAAGYVIDGFPRTGEQVSMMQGVAPVDALLYIDIAEEDAVNRLYSRGRSDDTPEQIANRIAEQGTGVADVVSAAENTEQLDVITVYDNDLARTPGKGINRMGQKINADIQTYYEDLK